MHLDFQTGGPRKPIVIDLLEQTDLEDVVRTDFHAGARTLTTAMIDRRREFTTSRFAASAGTIRMRSRPTDVY